MWENEFKKTYFRNIVLTALIVVIVAFLAVAMKFVSKSRAERDAALSAVSSQRQEEQNEAAKAAIASVLAEYQTDLDTVNKYMPGIVCWGDVLTAGSSGNISYPDVLKDYIDSEICDKFDFEEEIKDSINSGSMYSSLDWNSFKIDIPVVNMGSGEESTRTIMGRSGVSPYVLSKAVTIPASVEPVQIFFSSSDGSEVIPLTSGDVGVNLVTIDGIEGELTVETLLTGRYISRSYYFTRTEPGREKVMAKGTEIITAASEMYTDYIHIIWMGTYGGYSNVQELVEQTKAFLARQTSNTDRFIIIGLCTYGMKWETGNSSYMLDSIDTAMTQEFGNRYINLRKYLCSDGLSDAGLSATKNDTASIANGYVPNSFRSVSGTPEFTAKAYQLIGKLVFDRIDKLGYFDEIREELCIK